MKSFLLFFIVGEPVTINMVKLRKDSKIILFKEVKILPMVETEIKMVKSVTWK